ncbi:putative cyclase [Amycolatopsis sp. M39]|nr:putative cyclase [Amycolatopsis sp. M39]
MTHGSADRFGEAIVTRGVLLDLAPGGGTDLDAALERAGATLSAGDAVAVRGGWDINQPLGQPVRELDLSAVRWLSERGASVSVGDARPSRFPMPLHQVALARLGLPPASKHSPGSAKRRVAGASCWSWCRPGSWSIRSPSSAPVESSTGRDGRCGAVSHAIVAALHGGPAGFTFPERRKQLDPEVSRCRGKGGPRRFRARPGFHPVTRSWRRSAGAMPARPSPARRRAAEIIPRTRRPERSARCRPLRPGFAGSGLLNAASAKFRGQRSNGRRYLSSLTVCGPWSEASPSGPGS